ncbi:MAG: hypothetical protein H0Z34_05820 [Brevibacillus sp.]|nr:hypothetical protein [Brevibacillus sp.]
MDKRPETFNRREFLARLEVVKPLRQTDFETYQIVRERGSERHYLMYSFYHISLAEGGRRDEYQYFLPLDHDDVLAIVLGEQPYEYPEHWRSRYYRTGTDDRILPFEPDGKTDLEAEQEEERQLLEALRRYKQEWERTEDKEALTKKLFDEVAAIQRQRKDDDHTSR